MIVLLKFIILIKTKDINKYVKNIFNFISIFSKKKINLLLTSIVLLLESTNLLSSTPSLTSLMCIFLFLLILLSSKLNILL